ncbi:hypothetical protein H2198_002657 [Neophaeococcomyces mojaviensis]|uniref:Uncharacterized protein n=1 Tax=Neophaeococcomyces mojaviensis TaxID=3383035 RepID=A0ACC3ADT3_9EURO|nr:hypothetical protein H2198_002657 [Knufia sp. JES_112]
MTVLVAWLILGLGATFREHRKEMSVLDRRFIFFVRGVLGLKRNRRGGRISEKWQLTLQKLMLSLSDAHALAGLAILIAGFTQACEITVYHYHAVVYFGWISFSVHLITLSVARHYLRENKSLLIWRLILMFGLFGLLFAALCFTGSTAWPTSWDSSTPRYFYFDSPVFLLWTTEYMGKWRNDTIFALIILSLAFISRLLKLFKSTSEFSRKWLRTWPEDLLKKHFQSCRVHQHSSHNGSARAWWIFSSWGTLALYLYIRAIFDVFESLLVELLWLTLALTWGFTETFSWKYSSRFSQYEQKWGFGQVLPLLLVVAPLFAIPELLDASRSEAKSPTTPKAKQLHLFTTPRASGSDTSTELQRLHTPVDIDPRHDYDLHHKDQHVETFWTDHYYSGTNHITQSQVHTGTDILDDTKVAYHSKNYNALVVFVLISELGLFWSIAWPRFVTDPAASRTKTGDISAMVGLKYVLIVCTPIVVFPFVIWFLIMAPLSRTIRRAVR